MSKLSCKVVQDLLPLHVEQLTSEETRFQVDEHLAECGQCRAMFINMSQMVQIETLAPPPNKKLLFYLNSVRIWYLVCPMLALVLLHYDLSMLWYFYRAFLCLMCVVFISSQFTSGLTPMGFDMEQARFQQESMEKSQKRWGKYRVSPLTWCMPALSVLAFVEIPRIIMSLFDLYRSGFFSVS